MDHVAILSSRTKFFNKILTGEKTVESRWLASRRTPWKKVTVGETIYLKNSGNPITAKFTVKAVHEFEATTPLEIWNLLAKHHKQLGLAEEEVDDFYAQVKFKKYVVLIEIENVQMIRPFDINKDGFGNQAAWISVEDIEKIKI